jgi:hypothetical protein
MGMFLFSTVFWVFIYAISTPLALIAVEFFQYDKGWTAILNGYVFSTAFIFLFFGPFLTQTKGNRLNLAMANWILYLTVFTEVFIQIPHSLCAKQLHNAMNTPVEWAFYAYGLSDSRWRSYTGNSHQSSSSEYGLPFEVDLINFNDGLLGFIVLIMWYWWKHQVNLASVASANVAASTIQTNTDHIDQRRTYLLGAEYATSMKANKIGLLLGIIVLFRDATLFRETVEYLWTHHRSGYQWTTTDPILRPHAIYLLWAINGLWLLVPLVTPLWVYRLAMRASQLNSGVHVDKKVN